MSCNKIKHANGRWKYRHCIVQQFHRTSEVDSKNAVSAQHSGDSPPTSGMRILDGNKCVARSFDIHEIAIWGRPKSVKTHRGSCSIRMHSSLKGILIRSDRPQYNTYIGNKMTSDNIGTRFGLFDNKLKARYSRIGSENTRQFQVGQNFVLLCFVPVIKYCPTLYIL